MQKEYYTTSEIAEKFGVTVVYVRKIMRELGMKGKQNRKKLNKIEARIKHKKKPEMVYFKLRLTVDQRRKLKYRSEGTTMNEYILTKLEL